MIAAAGQAILHAMVAALVIEVLLRAVARGAPRRTPGAAMGGHRRARAAHDGLPRPGAVAGRGLVRRRLVPLRRRALEPRPPRRRRPGLGRRGGVLDARHVAVPAGRRAVRRRPPRPHGAGGRAPRRPSRLRARRDPASRRWPPAGTIARRRITVVAFSSPVLMCTGIDRPSIVVSTGTLDRLDDRALEAALAHEFAHLATRDPLTGWWLMAARTVQFFNPVVQILARQAVQELERRADIAVTAQGRAAGLADAVHRLSLAGGAHSDLDLPAGGGHPGARVLASAHRRALDARCQLLLEGAVPASRPHRAWRVGLAAVALGRAALLRGVVTMTQDRARAWLAVVLSAAFVLRVADAAASRRRWACRGAWNAASDVAGIGTRVRPSHAGAGLLPRQPRMASRRTADAHGRVRRHLVPAAPGRPRRPHRRHGEGGPAGDRRRGAARRPSSCSAKTGRWAGGPRVSPASGTRMGPCGSRCSGRRRTGSFWSGTVVPSTNC